MYLRQIFILFLLLLPCRIVAQGITQEQIPDERVRDVINSIYIKKYIKYDTINNIFQIDSTAIKNISRSELMPFMDTLTNHRSSMELALATNEQKDAEREARNSAEHMEIYSRLSLLETAQSLGEQRAKVLWEKFSYLPLGIHQMTNKQIGNGIFFAVTEISLPILGGVLACKSAKTNHLYKYEPYQSNIRHHELRNSRNWQCSGSIVCFLGAASIIWWNYCDNFKPFDNVKFLNNKDMCLVPSIMSDYRGRPQMAMNLSVRF